MSATLKTSSKPATRDRLRTAAAAEFNEAGYFGTDTNRIARRAGFAPQTFYRHFDDKRAVFLAVYGDWQTQESQCVAAAVRAESEPGRKAAAAARALIAFHARSAVFRRSLRLLAIEDSAVRQARVESRAAQIDALARLPGNVGRTHASLLAAVLKVERLCDALADGEVADQTADVEAFAAEVETVVADARGEV